MAKKRLSYSQIAEPKLLEPLIKELLAVKKVLHVVGVDLKKTFTELHGIAKATPPDSWKNVQKLEEVTDKAVKTAKEHVKVKKIDTKATTLLEKAIEQKNFASTEEAKKLALIKAETNKLNKERRLEAKAVVEQKDAYQNLVDASNEAQRAYKRLAAEFGENSKQAQAALLQFENINDKVQKIDKAARDGRKNVGRYELAIAGLTDQLKKEQKTLKDTIKAKGKYSTAAEAARKKVERLEEQVDDATKSMKLQARASEKAGNSFKKFMGALRKTSAVPALLALLAKLFSAITENYELMIKFEKASLEFSARFNTIATSIANFANGVSNAFNSLIGGKFQMAWRQAQAAFSSLDNVLTVASDRMARYIEEGKRLIDLRELDKEALIKANEEIAKNIQKEEELRLIHDSNTYGLLKRKKAGEDLLVLMKTRQELENTEARNSLKLLKLKLENEKNFSKTTGEYLIRTKKLRLDISAAEREYNERVTSQLAEQTAVRREILQIDQDYWELRLDFLIDDLESQKQANREIIKSDEETFKRRRELIEENKSRTEESLEGQVRLINQVLKKEGKGLTLTLSDIAAFSKKTSGEIFDQIQQWGFSEILTSRFREILKEYRIGNTDAAESVNQVNASEKERDKTLDVIRLNLEAINKLNRESADVEKILEESRVKRRIEELTGLKARLAGLKEGSKVYTDVQAQIVEIELKIAEEGARKRQEARDEEVAALKEAEDKKTKVLEEAAQRQYETLKTATDALAEMARKRATDRQRAVDEELSAEEKRIDRLEELAARGDEDAEKNVALSEKRAAQLRLQKEKELRDAQRAELAIAAIQAYAGAVQKGKEGGAALAETIANISVLRAFIQTLPSFSEGVEDTGTVDKPIDAKGGRLAVLHDNERVLTKEQNLKIGKFTNNELANLALKERLGGNTPDLTPQMLEEIKTLNATLKNRPVYLGTDFDAVTKTAIVKIKKGAKLEKIRQRKGGLWG